TYRYFLSGKFSDTPISADDITFLAGAWKDISGNPVTAEQIASGDAAHLSDGSADPVDSISAEELRGRLWLDVKFTPVNGGEVDVTSVTDDEAEFTLTGAGGENLAPAGVLQVNATTFRYLYRGQLDAGPLDVTFIAGSWQDTAGNAGPAASARVNVITQSQSYFIDLSGGILLNSAGLLDEPLLDLRAQVTLELDFERDVFTLDF